MKVLRFLLGLAIGAGIAVLFAPKSGRELRRQLVGGGSGKLLGAGGGAMSEYTPPDWGGAATAVVEPEVAVYEVEDKIVVVEEPAVEEPAGEDLRARIEETRAAVENELAEPFAAGPVESTEDAAIVADDAAAVAAEADIAADDAVVDAVEAEVVAEEAVAQADVAEAVAEEAVYEAVAAEEVADEAVAEVLEAPEDEAAEAELAAEAAVQEADATTALAEEAVAVADEAEAVAEEAIIEAADSGAVAEEAIVRASEEEEFAAQAAADVADEVVAEEVIIEAPVVEEEPVPLAGPVPPPPLATSTPSQAEAEPAVAEEPVREHAWDIDYGDEQAAAAADAAPTAAIAEEAVSAPVAEEVVTSIDDKVVVVEEPALAEEPVVAEEPVPAPVVAESAAVVPEPEPVAEEIVADVDDKIVVVEEPGTETPAGAVPDQPAGQREGGAIDQAEMRRRIEETRARLKAKAFDAMMSGEAALLSRDSGDRSVPSGESPGLDAETDSAIDESLSQEEY
jgi:hypothetical protein